MNRERLMDLLMNETNCCIQHDGWSCNTCFHAMEGLNLTKDIHEYWEAVLAYRGDYPKLSKNPKLLNELVSELERKQSK